MRTTLTLDEDVAEKAKKLAAKLGRSFKSLVNDALRCGLAEVEKPAISKAYRTEPHEMGEFRTSIDNIGEVLAQIEGEDHR